MANTPTVVNSGTLTPTVGTETDLIDISTAGVYVLVVDINALVTTEEVELRAYTKVLSGGTSRLTDGPVTGTVDVANKIVETRAYVLTEQAKFTLTQVGGTARAFPWKVLAL